MLVHSRGGVLRSVGRADWPVCVVTDEGAEEVLDGVAVGRGVLRDAFQRVDAADADIDIVAAQRFTARLNRSVIWPSRLMKTCRQVATAPTMSSSPVRPCKTDARASLAG